MSSGNSSERVDSEKKKPDLIYDQLLVQPEGVVSFDPLDTVASSQSLSETILFTDLWILPHGFFSILKKFQMVDFFLFCLMRIIQRLIRREL